MTRIKICGLRTAQDIQVVATLPCSYVGFVFARASRRAITFEHAKTLRKQLLCVCANKHKTAPATVGVFVNEAVDVVAHCLNSGVCDICQLHGVEDENYIARLRKLTDKPCIQALRITSAADVTKAQHSKADYVLLDAGAGDGKRFNWTSARAMTRPYFLAGGLNSQNVTEAITLLHPFAVDVSSGVEEQGHKSELKMNTFCTAVVNADKASKKEVQHG